MLRWGGAIAALLVVQSLVLAGIFWVLATGSHQRSAESGFTADCRALAAVTTGRRPAAVRAMLIRDIHRDRFLALFDPAGRLIEGNVARLPADATAATTSFISAVRPTELPGKTSDTARLRLCAMPDGSRLLTGVDLDDAEEALRVVERSLLLGLVPFIRHAFGPAITFLRQLPPLAYFSLLIIWFGIDESPKIVLLVIAAMPPIIVATAAGIDGVNRDYIHAAQSLGAHRLSLIRTVLLPASLPEIFTGIRLGVGVAYTSVVAAETVNGLPGIGGMIRDAQRYNQTSVVILGILVLGLTGLVIELCLSRLQARMTPWRGRA